MNLPIYQVDAFTRRVFGGNPAAVVLLEEPLPEETMQNIAAENNLSETAFVLPDGDRFQIRWVTPTVEVDLCGHATLASAHILFSEGIVAADSVRFETLQSGPLFVTRSGELLSLDFPARESRPLPPPVGLAETLGAVPTEVYQSVRDLLAVFEDEATIAQMKPDFQRLEQLEWFAVIVTAPGLRSDFVSRFFGPKVGIPEDPVTGSAHCVLVPYWADRLGKSRLHALQISRRGGELFCEHRGERVIISGHAAGVLKGTISF
jgi:PhzF family phenazine biosynthesis protein